MIEMLAPAVFSGPGSGNHRRRMGINAARGCCPEPKQAGTPTHAALAGAPKLAAAQSQRS
ncbi:hypothetical protein [Streptomyces decoyicus]